MTGLLIDFGNSSCKYAVASGGRLISWGKGDGAAPAAEARSLFGAVRPDVTWVSSVRGLDASVLEELSAEFGAVEVLNSRTPLPIGLQYDTPETLGTDRVAGAVGANSLFPGRDVLIFDFGTATTVDRVTSEGVFAGGNIALGLKSRLKALHLLTEKLPEAPLLEGLIRELGASTESALVSGAVSGTVFEVEGYIRRYPGHTVIFSGGDALFLAKRMKCPIFADYCLVLRGLANIAEYNAKG